ncbi:MAG TPA: hypothetical protein VGA49_00155, partial [Patescibacteria group bacterium]
MEKARGHEVLSHKERQARIKELKSFVESYQGLREKQKEIRQELLETEIKDKAKQIFIKTFQQVDTHHRDEYCVNVGIEKRSALTEVTLDDWEQIERHYFNLAREQLGDSGLEQLGEKTFDQQVRDKAWEIFDQKSDSDQRSILNEIEADRVLFARRIPEEIRKVQDHPDLINQAKEEILAEQLPPIDPGTQEAAEFFDTSQKDSQLAKNRFWDKMRTELEEKVVSLADDHPDAQPELKAKINRNNFRLRKYFETSPDENKSIIGRYQKELVELEALEPKKQGKKQPFEILKTDLEKAEQTIGISARVAEKREEILKSRTEKILNPVLEQEAILRKEIKDRVKEVYAAESRENKKEIHQKLGQRGYQANLPWILKKIEDQYLSKAVKIEVPKGGDFAKEYKKYLASKTEEELKKFLVENFNNQPTDKQEAIAAEIGLKMLKKGEEKAWRTLENKLRREARNQLSSDDKDNQTKLKAKIREIFESADQDEKENYGRQVGEPEVARKSNEFVKYGLESIYGQAAIGQQAVDLNDQEAIQIIINAHGTDYDKHRLGYLEQRGDVVVFIDQQAKEHLKKRVEEILKSLSDDERRNLLEQIGQAVEGKFDSLKDCINDQLVRKRDQEIRAKARSKFESDKADQKDELMMKIGQEMIKRDWRAFWQVVEDNYDNEIKREDFTDYLRHNRQLSLL